MKKDGHINYSVCGLEGVSFHDLFTFHNTITRGSGYKLFKHFSHLNVGKFSFAERIIDDWNQLATNISDRVT